MIEFGLSEEQTIVQSMISEFAKTVIQPQARRLDDDGSIDAETLSALWSLEIIQSQIVQGDADPRSPVTNALILEELGAADVSVAVAIASTMAFVQAINDQGTNDQRELVHKMFSGKDFTAAAIALTEPDFAFDVSALKTKAVKSGTDYVLTGVKSMVPMAGQCACFLVIADLDGVPAAFIIQQAAANLHVAAPGGTLGLRAAQLATVTLDGVKVSSTMRLGGTPDIQGLINSARTGIACILTGLSKGIMDHVIPYTKERVVHGVPLAQKQAVAFNIADMHIDIESMRWMNWRAAWELQTGLDATRQAQLAYTYASMRAMKIADDGLQAFGGHGFVQAHPLELWYRNARTLSVLEGIAGV